MKMVFSALMLMTFISCEGNESTAKQKRTCTYNDQQVNCEQLGSGTAGESSDGVVLVASVQSDIQVSANKITFTENTHDESVEVINGEEHSCEIGTENDLGFTYQIEGKNLKLIYPDGTSEVYIRQGSPSKKLEGTWVLKVQDEMGLNVLSLNFMENEVQVTQECHFN